MSGTVNHSAILQPGSRVCICGEPADHAVHGATTRTTPTEAAQLGARFGRLVATRAVCDSDRTAIERTITEHGDASHLQAGLRELEHLRREVCIELGGVARRLADLLGVDPAELETELGL